MPTSAQSLCLPSTYHCEPGSSPTRTVPRPGHDAPLARARPPARSSSALMAAAVAVPSRICAVTAVIRRVSAAAQWKKCRVPVKYIVTPAALRGLDDLARRGPSRRAARRRDAGVDQDLQAVGEREERVGRGDRAGGPLPGPLDREPAGVDPVDLAHADADGGAVRRRAGSRWTSPRGRPARRTRGRRARSSAAGLAGRQRPGRPGRRPVGVDAVARPASAAPPVIGRNSTPPRRRRRARPAAGCSSSPASTSTAPSS